MLRREGAGPSAVRDVRFSRGRGSARRDRVRGRVVALRERPKARVTPPLARRRELAETLSRTLEYRLRGFVRAVSRYENTGDGILYGWRGHRRGL